MTIGDRPRFSTFFCVVFITICLLAQSPCFPWSYPAPKHYGYFFCEPWVTKGKIPIGGPADLVNDTRLHLLTEKFSVGGLPFFTGPASA